MGKQNTINIKKKDSQIEVIPTGLSSLEGAIGFNGIPRGCLVLITGSRKTIFALYVTGNIQKQGGKVALIDIGHHFDRIYADRLGVNISKLMISQSPRGGYEQVSAVVEALLKSNVVDLIIIDGIEGLFKSTSRKVRKKSVKDSYAILTNWLELSRHSKTSIAALCKRKETTFFPERFFKLRADLKIDLEWQSQVKLLKKKNIEGFFKIFIYGNKFAPPFRKAEIYVSEKYLNSRRKRKSMGLETICSDCATSIAKGEMYWVKKDENGREEYVCTPCVSEKTSRGIEEDIKKYGKVIFSGLD